MRRILCGLLAATVFAHPAYAARAQTIDDPRLDRESARAAQALIDSARAEKLPAKVLNGVLQEGLSRHANGTRIVHAMQDYLRALRGASTALGSNSTETELVSGAGALLAGVPPGALTQIRAARGKEPVVVPLVVLGDLVARGVPAPAAGVAIANATRSGLADPDFYTLREHVEHDIASGVAAGVALESVARRFLTPAPSSADSVARPRKPASDPGNYGRLELRQLGGGATGALRDLRGGALISLGAQSRFAFAADAQALDGAPLTGNSARVNASFLAGAGSYNSGIAVGPGLRMMSTDGASWLSPTLQANAWHRMGPWAFSLDATLGGAPTRSMTGTSTNPLASILRVPTRVRFDAIPSDTPIVHAPTAPTHVVSVDSSAPSTALTLPGTATEARLAVSRQFGRFSVEGAAGVRAYAARRADAWSSASISMPVLDRVGVIAGAVIGPENILAPVSGSRFFAGIQLATAPPVRSPPPSAPAHKASVAFRAVSHAAATTIEIHAESARSVEVAGDFTDWAPLSLSTKGRGEWSVTRVIEPGIHHIRMRIDGGEWAAPPDLPRLADVFGGEIGVLTIGVL